MAGRLIGGRYEPLDVLGQGGQGRVLRCRDHQHDRIVALKIRPVAGPQAREQALREARTLLALEAHRNVAVVRDDFFADGDHVLVMEHVAGEDLARRLRAGGGGGLPPQDVLAWLTDVASALDHLHGSSPPVVHGDVKPANIVVSGGRAVLVDFGLAGSAPRSRATRRYAAPELAAGGRSAASDVFALAASAHELLTGRPPEPGADADWSHLPEAARVGVRAAIAEGLAIDPDRRPASAGALVAAMRAAVDGEVTGDVTARVAQPAGLVVPARLQLLGGLIAALLLAGTFAAAAEVRSERDRGVIAAGATTPGDAAVVDRLGPRLEDDDDPTMADPAGVATTTTTTIPADGTTLSIPTAPVVSLDWGIGGDDGQAGPTVVAPGPTPTTGPRLPAPTTLPTSPPTSPPTTVTAPQLRGRLIVYRDLSMDVYDLDGSGAPRPRYRQDHFASWPTIIGIGNDLLFFYRSSDALNSISRVGDGAVLDIDAHSFMSQGFTHVVDVGPGPGRVFVYRSTDGHSGSLDIAADGHLLDEDGYRFDLPTGFDRLASVGGGRVVLYRSSDGAALVLEPKAADVLVQVGSTTLPAGWAVLVGTADGNVLGLDANGNGSVLRFSGATPTTVGSVALGAGYTVGGALDGGVVLHDPSSGRGTVLRMDGAGRVLGAAPFTTAAGAVVAAVS